MTEKKTDPLPPEIAALSFEEALGRLEAIVQQLEAGEVDLQKSIDIYKQGTYLKRHCQAKLDAAKAQIEQIRVHSDGAVTTTPFEVD
ncbi:MAG: exodeoxyribonuclease VII small subunit [Pseudomonadota bacterium]